MKMYCSVSKGMIIIILLVTSGCSVFTSNNNFQSSWPVDITRIWIGSEYWTNPLQDWRLNNNRIECIVSGGNRNVYLLTYELGENADPFRMSVNLGKLDPDVENLDNGWVGFRVGVKGEFNDYRDSAVHGNGYRVGLTTNGELFIGKLDTSLNEETTPLDNIRLELVANPAGENYNLALSVYSKNGELISRLEKKNVDQKWLVGGVALVCSFGKIKDLPDIRPVLRSEERKFKGGAGRKGNVRFWFSDWQLQGAKVTAYPDQKFGPILFSQYTLSNEILKLTAQMAPIGDKDDQKVLLQIKKGNSDWATIADAEIDNFARIASLRCENWDGTADVPYRLVYKCYSEGNKLKEYYFHGAIRKEPWDKEEIVIAGFTGNNDLGFPNNDILKNVKYHNPDVLFFSGDQIYEGVAGYGVQRNPVDKAALDYLRKWYLYGWAYRDLLKNRPSVAIPDDHDVYHGNIWGAGGKATPPGLVGADAQDLGGYKMDAAWVNMVQLTQTSHLPDPYDPTPVEQNIGVYYCNMNYAGVSFAILEDRKFKSAPKPILPEAKIHNGWAQNRHFDEKKDGDVKGAVLLGDRQMNFLKSWADDWKNRTWMKVALSQTIFANVATLPEKDSFHDRIVPTLRIMEKNEYPPDDVPVSDLDSNGWPQTPRNNAIKELRRGFAFHLAGDQHLGSTIQYGADSWNDAGFAFCVPAISNVWPRRWYPMVPGKNRLSNSPKYTGDFEDGFGNKITVHAVSNPVFTGLKPSRLYDRATGYGIVRLNRNTRDITIECWPRLSDPISSDKNQYPGWPIKINQLDNYGRKATAYLPTINVKGMVDPVIQIIYEKTKQVVYTLRISGQSFRPKIFEDGSYSIRIGEPGTDREKILQNISSISIDMKKEIEVKFE